MDNTKQIKEEIINEILEFIGFRNLDDFSQRYIKAEDLINKLNQIKEQK